MPFIRNLIYDTDAVQAALDDALAYAGGRFAEELHTAAGTMPGTNIDGCLFLYEGPDTSNRILFFGIGGSTLRCAVGAYAEKSRVFSTQKTSPPSVSLRIAATKYGIALSLLDADGNCADEAIVITRDSTGAFCCLMTGADGGGFDSPAVVPRDSLYTAKICYSSSTDTDFGCTALSLLPVPSSDGTAKYLPDLLFAQAGQIAGDGTVLLNGERFYVLGGSWYLRDAEADAV
ncbi:MAG: hypothetical protein II723_06205 [Oscillospiraceae bacterium]|nr:hypothetical protein [Oscillospiraceae bacterium]